MISLGGLRLYCLALLLKISEELSQTSDEIRDTDYLAFTDQILPDILCYLQSFHLRVQIQKIVRVDILENSVSDNMNLGVGVHVKADAQVNKSLGIQVTKGGVSQGGPGAKTTCPPVFC